MTVELHAASTKVASIADELRVIGGQPQHVHPSLTTQSNAGAPDWVA